MSGALPRGMQGLMRGLSGRSGGCDPGELRAG
jgi:hypothetical protein